MTDLKPEDREVFALREAFHKTTAALLTHGHARDILRELEAAGFCLSLLADRARMEKALLQVETMLARCEDKAKPNEDPQFHYSQLVGMRKGLFSARKIARQALGAPQ